MADTDKKIPAGNIPAKKPVKKTGYVDFRDLPRQVIEGLPTCHVTLEKRSSKNYGDSVSLLAIFHPKFRKDLSNRTYFGLNKYELVKVLRKFEDNKDKHELDVPCRFLVRHNAAGEVEYKRVEVALHRKAVASGFLDETDLELLDVIDFPITWIEDKDSTKAFAAAKADVDYDIYG
ncbi:hypothetical protein KQ51_01400 [Candidatus Izimaplasma bacterium HR1]|jgi:hypothetical protein|uniref:hypothetical protein n=1 Tax=Candidatus Izimoplasma sp. HR1 TaxID=1541959 RepID=UPI0004F769ED|nr:hypothetical protein KQ51_01400 [Candidatus Izimaplasma bacterium HR1]